MIKFLASSVAARSPKQLPVHQISCGWSSVLTTPNREVDFLLSIMQVTGQIRKEPLFIMKISNFILQRIQLILMNEKLPHRERAKGSMYSIVWINCYCLVSFWVNFNALCQSQKQHYLHRSRDFSIDLFLF